MLNIFFIDVDYIIRSVSVVHLEHLLRKNIVYSSRVVIVITYLHIFTLFLDFLQLSVVMY